jgi:peptide/nickel transport system substrate-binding protein
MLGQQFDMVIISWTNLNNNPDDALFFGSENDVPGRGFNFVSYYNPTLDELWRQAATLPGCLAADRGVLYRQIQATLHDELPYSWLYAPLSLTGASKRLIGIDPGPWGTWYNVETWYLANG